MNADGSGQIKLTSGDGNDDNPRWSPNSTAILFQSDRDHPDTGCNDIYLMNAGGTGLVRLTTDPNDDSSAAWSPDGNRIVFQSLRNSTFYQLYSMNADGTGQANLSVNQFGDYSSSWASGGGKPLPTEEASAAPANQVTINFNNLPANSIVTNQYLPHVTFSGNGFSAGSNPPFGTDVIARLLSPYAPPQLGIIARDTYRS